MPPHQVSLLQVWNKHVATHNHLQRGHEGYHELGEVTQCSIMQYRLTNCAIWTIFFQLCEKYSLVFWVASRRRKKPTCKGTITLKWDIVPLPMNAIFQCHDSLGKSAGNILCVYMCTHNNLCIIYSHLF
jgi:hypothetical protein